MPTHNTSLYYGDLLDFLYVRMLFLFSSQAQFNVGLWCYNAWEMKNTNSKKYYFFQRFEMTQRYYSRPMLGELHTKQLKTFC